MSEHMLQNQDEISVSRTVLGLVVFADGAFTAVFGYGAIRWFMRNLPRQFRDLVRPFLELPEPLLRVLALMQAILGAWLFLANSSQNKE